MEHIFDTEKWRQGPQPSGNHDNGSHPDWHALQSRLRAAREARLTVLAEIESDLTATRGSFAPVAAKARALAPIGKRGVNLRDSTNRNADGGMDGNAADESRAGDRG